MDGIAVVSGGLDSVTLTHHLLAEGRRPGLLSFNYGQRHGKELGCAAQTARRLGLEWHLVDLRSVTRLIGTSALTGGQPVPEGHYAAGNMAVTVVPNRNMVMLSVAVAAAVSRGLGFVAAGMHTGDHAQYPDCRPVFLAAMDDAVAAGNEGFLPAGFTLLAPFLTWSKNDIAARAHDLGVQPADTWSCYQGGPVHCGRCGTCVERLEAIDSVGDPGWDRTAYADLAYWREAVAE